MLLVLLTISVAFWLVQALAAWKVMAAVRAVESLPRVERQTWPTVSLIVPARDEGATVRAALEARLHEGYPALEVVLVDDRSVDDTGAQARALAAHDARLTVTRVDELPDGWLGKVNALRQGLSAARGEWVLFSDADVHLAPGTMQRLVGWAEAEGVDHVCALPSIRPGDALTSLSLAAFFRIVVTVPRLWAVERPESKAAVGIGAFNLFRRRALEASPGLEWLKMEIGDDMALGVMLKRAGASQRVVVAREAISLVFYPSFGAMARALEKNGAQLPWPLMGAGLLLLVLAEWGWVAGLALPGWWPVALGVAALSAVTNWALAGWLRNPRAPALGSSLGSLLLAGVLARASFLAWRRGGVVWRGTFYPTATVRAGRRL